MLEIIIVALCLFLAVLLFDYFKLKSVVSKYSIVYVDTGGTGESPPSFIDLLKGKTLNVKINEKHYLTIQHFGFFENVFYVEKMQSLYNSLRRFLREIEGLPLQDKDRAQKQLIIATAYKEIGKVIYQICKRWNKQRGFKKAFFKKFYGDVDWAYNLSEEIIKYWLLTKKKLQGLAVAISDPRILGDLRMLNSLSVDTTGKLSQKPRYDFSLN